MRETAREAGVDPRVVARAFRQLQTEGLVEIRGRSGVYVAPQERRDGEILPETMRWMTGLIVESWRRMIRLPELPDFVRRCTGAARVRCALVESVEDAVRAYSLELEWDLRFDVQLISLDDAPEEDSEAWLLGELEDADLIVTTSFYAQSVNSLAQKLEKPLVLLKTHPECEAEIRRRLELGSLIVVAADPRFGDRIRTIYGQGLEEDRIQVVLADDAGATAELDLSEPVLLTRAAHERLGDITLTLIFPHSPSFSPESARDLAEVLIGFNQQALQVGSS